MKKNILIGLSLSLIIPFAVTSCKDYLKEDPKGSVAVSNYMSSPNDCYGAVDGIFNAVGGASNTAHHYAHAWMGDDITTLKGGNKEIFREFERFEIGNNNKNVNMIWNSNFGIVKACNFVLENLPAVKEGQHLPPSDSLMNVAINDSKAQALFWRAFAYFRLVKCFGDLPIITSAAYTKSNATIAKSSKEDVLKFIEKGLNEALGLARESYTDTDVPMMTNNLYNYVNKGAVQATLAAVYMAHAGYPFNGGQEYYKKAAEMAKAVIDGVKDQKYPYALEANYANKYKYVSNNSSKEIVLGYQYNKDNDVWPWGWGPLSSWLGVTQGYESVYGGWSDALGELTMFKNMPQSDRRDVIYGPNNGQVYVPNKPDIFFENAGKMIDWYAQGKYLTPKLDENGNKIMQEKPDPKDPNKKIKVPVMEEKTGYLVRELQPMIRVLFVSLDGDKPIDYDPHKEMWNQALSSQTLHFISYDEVLLWYAESVARSGEAVNADAIAALQAVIDRSYKGATGAVPSAATLAGNPEEFAKQCMLEHGYEVAGYYPALVPRADDQMRMDQLKDNFAARQANAPIEVAPGVQIQEKVTIDPSAVFDPSHIFAPAPFFDSGLNKNI